MNGSCDASVFVRWGKQYLRCSWDGRLWEITGQLGAECPLCGRPMETNGCDNPEQYVEVLLHIDLPHYYAQVLHLESELRQAQGNMHAWAKRRGLSAGGDDVDKRIIAYAEGLEKKNHTYRAELRKLNARVVEVKYLRLLLAKCQSKESPTGGTAG